MRVGLLLLVVASSSCARSEPAVAPLGAAPPATTRTTTGDSAASSPREALARRVVDELGAAQFQRVSDRFDAGLKGRLSVASLEETWRGVLASAGAYLRTTSVHLERREDFDVFFLRTLFDRGERETLVALDARDRVVGIAFRPVPAHTASYAPPYADRSRFHEQELRVPDPAHFCGTGTCGLPGTLSLPRGAGPFPAVVLLHGSGPQDRDQRLGESRPFRDLAWGLASRGVAVLRYEKRTEFLRGRLDAAQIEALTVEQEFVEDARSAIALLRATAGVDAQRVFVLGHSQGGAVLPRLARSDAALAGFVCLAAPLRPLEDVVLDQVRFLAESDGQVDATETAELRRLKEQVARVKSLRPDTQVPASELPLGIPRAYWLDLAENPPAPALATERRPFLVLQGERDYQVTLADFSLWKAALAHSPVARFKTYARLNHLFIAGEGPITAAEYMRPGHVAAEVVEDIASFVNAVRPTK